MFVKSAISDHVKNLIRAVGCEILTESFGHVVTNCQWYFKIILITQSSVTSLAKFSSC